MAEVMLQSSLVLGVATLFAIAGSTLTRNAGDRLAWTLITVATGMAFLLSLAIAVQAQLH